MRKYARELQADMKKVQWTFDSEAENRPTLRYLAGIIPVSRYRAVRHYHPHAKQLRTRNKQLNNIFHAEGRTVKWRTEGFKSVLF